MSTSPIVTDHVSARAWADRWIEAWNALDIESVLALFADDCQFRSPKAAVITGCGTVIGKPALRAYWTRAIENIAHLRFTLASAHWDGVQRTLLIRYTAELAAQRLLAAEVFDFLPDGRVICGTAFYGASTD